MWSKLNSNLFQPFKLNSLISKSISASSINFESSLSLSEKITKSADDQLKPFSKLFVNEKYKRVTYKVVEPELKLESYLDDEYLGRLNEVIKLRDVDELKGINWTVLKDDVQELIDRRARLKKNLSERNVELIEKENVDLFKLEEKLVPILLKLPNLFDRQEVPLDDDKILRATRTKFYKFKLLDCKRISYLNDFRKSSIIGPHCEYLLGKGALINLAIQKYFRNSIKDAFPEPKAKIPHRHLHEVDGLDMIKSALVEASNDFKRFDYQKDTRRLDLHETDAQQHLHLVGSSRESVLSLLIKKRIDNVCLPARFIQFGSTYEQNLKQIHRICMFSLVENDHKISDNEFKRMEQVIWSIYEQFNIPIRMRRLSIKNLNLNEYNKVELDVYFPYSREWKVIADFAHYSDYLTTRVHDTSHHCLSGNLTDVSLLLDAILENNQTETGELVLPDCIEKLMC